MIARQASGSREIRGASRPAPVLLAVLLGLGAIAIVTGGLLLLGSGKRESAQVSSKLAIEESVRNAALGALTAIPRERPELLPVERVVANSEEVEQEAPEPPAKRAYLDVVVIDVDTGKTRRDVMVNVLRPRKRAGRVGWELEDQHSSDENGCAHFALRAGVDYSVYTSKSFRFFSAGMHVRLEPGERRELDLAFRSYQGGRFVGLVVDANGGAIPEARIKVLDVMIQAGDFGRDLGRSTYFEMEVDPTGIFEFHCDPGRNVTGFASASGYVRRPFVVHGAWDLSKPFIVRLAREVRAEFSVVSQHGEALSNVEVTLMVEFLDLLQEPAPHEPSLRAKPRWKAVTDHRGRCLVEGLPPETPIYILVHPLPDRSKWSWQPAAKKLSPGRDSQLEIVVEI